MSMVNPSLCVLLPKAISDDGSCPFDLHGLASMVSRTVIQLPSVAAALHLTRQLRSAPTDKSDPHYNPRLDGFQGARWGGCATSVDGPSFGGLSSPSPPNPDFSLYQLMDDCGPGSPPLASIHAHIMVYASSDVLSADYRNSITGDISRPLPQRNSRAKPSTPQSPYDGPPPSPHAEDDASLSPLLISIGLQSETPVCGHMACASDHQASGCAALPVAIGATPPAAAAATATRVRSPHRAARKAAVAAVSAAVGPNKRSPDASSPSAAAGADAGDSAASPADPYVAAVARSGVVVEYFRALEALDGTFACVRNGTEDPAERAILKSCIGPTVTVLERLRRGAASSEEWSAEEALSYVNLVPPLYMG